MELSFEKIKDITVGAVRIEKEGKAISFFKCTQKQVDAWVALQNDMLGRAESTTGIRLDFHTDSKKVVFEVSGAKFEVLINGALVGQYLECGQKEYTISLDLSGDDNRVTLVFPSHHSGKLFSVKLDDNSFIRPHKFDKKILFIGDSITQGWNSKYDSMSFAYRVSNFFNAESVIYGIGGAFYHPSTFDKINFNPDTVIVAYGCNDYAWYSTTDALKTNATEFLKLIKEEYSGKRIIALLPIWRADCDEPQKMGIFADCRNTLTDVFNKLNIEFIDAYNFVPHISDFYDDIVHPVDLGFGVYAQELIREFQKRGI